MESSYYLIGYMAKVRSLKVSAVGENSKLRSRWRASGNTITTLVRQSSTLQLAPKGIEPGPGLLIEGHGMIK
jgi:hypothetical protein